MIELTELVNAYRENAQNKPDKNQVVDALIQSEKIAKKQRLTYSFTSLLGKWQLCFATGTRKAQKRGGIILGKGFYLPKLIPASISFTASDASSNKGEITNQIQVGFLLLKLSGLCRYLEKKNILCFDFHHITISLFNRIVYDGNIRGSKTQASNFYDTSISKLPFFAFFLVTEDFIAARGRGGGLAIWVKERD
ncbi:hypothetical protein [Calothrix sp. UHCC 0171]|uniref:hypothetical protein n=1 Tax=Calothrix sp. UHCC 0171 TaxID=3110245 RepID=UPI002B21CEC6|nr:hypothetical protein [Calothrix sp. UHCC 0171]MEA5569815.1 hypothetical protein [Calothrix sp. UHCC 0171]